jgi:hypothetical protein
VVEVRPPGRSQPDPRRRPMINPMLDISQS